MLRRRRFRRASHGATGPLLLPPAKARERQVVLAAARKPRRFPVHQTPISTPPMRRSRGSPLVPILPNEVRRIRKLSAPHLLAQSCGAVPKIGAAREQDIFERSEELTSELQSPY